MCGRPRLRQRSFGQMPGMTVHDGSGTRTVTEGAEEGNSAEKEVRCLWIKGDGKVSCIVGRTQLLPQGVEQVTAEFFRGCIMCRETYGGPYRKRGEV